MIRWESAADLILPRVVDCPWPMARQELALAAREFYSKSLAWRYDMPAFPVQAGLSEYDAVDQLDAEVVRVLSGWIDRDELTPLTADELLAHRARGETGGPPKYVSYVDDSLTLLPAPSQGGAACRVSIALRPTLSTKGLPNQLWADHIVDIVEGARARLHLTQGKPYSDTTLGIEAKTRFDDAVLTEYWKRAKNSTRGRGRVKAYFY
jgi:hypothetical protein